MFALNVDINTNRILSATFPKYATDDMPIVKTLPDGNLSDYLYVNGDYVYEPLPKSDEPAPMHEATTDEILNTLLGVTDDE